MTPQTHETESSLLESFLDDDDEVNAYILASHIITRVTRELRNAARPRRR